MTSINSRLTSDLISFVNQSNSNSFLGNVLEDNTITNQEYENLKSQYTQLTGASEDEFNQALESVLGISTNLFNYSSHQPIILRFTQLDNDSVMVDSDNNITNGINSIVSNDQSFISSNESVIYSIGSIRNFIDESNFSEVINSINDLRNSENISSTILDIATTQLTERIRTKVNSLMSSPESLTNYQLNQLNDLLTRGSEFLTIQERGEVRSIIQASENAPRMTPLSNTGHFSITFGGLELSKRLDFLPRENLASLPSPLGYTLPSIPLGRTGVNASVSLDPFSGSARRAFTGLGASTNILDGRVTTGATIMRTDNGGAFIATIGGVLR